MALFDSEPYTTPEFRETTAHLRVVAESSVKEMTDPEWLTRSAAEGLRAREFFMWQLKEEKLQGVHVLDRLSDLGEIVSTVHYRRSGRMEALIRIGGALVDISLHGTGLWVGAAAKTTEEASGTIDAILSLLPERKLSDDATPTIGFSVWSSQTAEPYRRTTEVPTWEDISINYAAETRDQLAALMDPEFDAGKGGRLLLLHGEPGTGKSTALTTLAWQWRSWAELNLIADPAVLLGEADYLMNVSLSRRPDTEWKLVLLEDSGGMFSRDAKQHSGEDRLGRLLNSTDGLLGNASKALWVLTTNEPLESFHAALSRPGRMAAAVEFLPLSEAESKLWMEKHERTDLAETLTGKHTLAELYALLHGNAMETQSKTQPVGFRSAK